MNSVLVGQPTTDEQPFPGQPMAENKTYSAITGETFLPTRPFDDREHSQLGQVTTD